MSNKNITRQRYFLVDGLRGIAAIAVMVRHLSQHTYTPLFANGRIASDIFIFAGGFMTAYAYHHRLIQNLSLRGFFMSRLARLYPLFIFGWLLGVINLTVKTYTQQSDYTYFSIITSSISNLLWLPYFSDYSVDIVFDKTVGAVFPGNDPAWALALIFWSSILYAYMVTRQKTKWIMAVILTSAIGLFIFVKMTYMAGPGWESNKFVGGVARTLFCFFGGVFLCLYWSQIKRYIPVVKWPHITLPIAILLLLALPNFPGYYILWLGLVYTAVPFLVTLAIAAQVESKAIENICTELGKLSYPVYCIHYPIFSVYSATKPNTNLAPLEIAALVTGIIILAHLLVRFYDEPVAAWSKRKGIR